MVHIDSGQRVEHTLDYIQQQQFYKESHKVQLKLSILCEIRGK